MQALLRILCTIRPLHTHRHQVLNVFRDFEALRLLLAIFFSPLVRPSVNTRHLVGLLLVEHRTPL